MGSLHRRADEIAATLRAAGVRAVVDVRDAASNLPAVLVPPPQLDLVGGDVATWRLVALASSTVGDLAAWDELDELVAGVAYALPLEAADPSSYVLGDRTHPAYLLTYVEGVDLDHTPGG